MQRKNITGSGAVPLFQGWVLLLFRLPIKQASGRVEIWRRLKRYGALPLRGSGYLLPQSSTNQEHFAWLAETIRKYKGEASLLQVASIDDLPEEKLRGMFQEARSRDYRALMRDIDKLASSGQRDAKYSRARKRLHDIMEIDFFRCPLQIKVAAMMEQASPKNPKQGVDMKITVNKKDYTGRKWVTRPRPKVDRVSSAWLIHRFIDPRARFVFASDPAKHKNAVPFDMYQPGSFGHRGEDCTFETLCKEFGIRDKKVAAIAEAVHDADLLDEKFGRNECVGLLKILEGWIKQGVEDKELLKRGMQMVEALYLSIE